MSKGDDEVTRVRKSDGSQWQSQVLVRVAFGKDSDAAVAGAVVSGSALTVSCRDETMVWVFTQLFHLQICMSEGGP